MWAIKMEIVFFGFDFMTRGCLIFAPLRLDVK